MCVLKPNKVVGFTTWNWGTKPILFRWPMREKMQATNGEESSNVMRTLLWPGTGFVWMVHGCFIRIHKGLLDNFSVAGCFFTLSNFYCSLSNLKNMFLWFSGDKHVHVIGWVSWSWLDGAKVIWWAREIWNISGAAVHVATLCRLRSHVPWSWDLHEDFLKGYMLWEEKMIQKTTQPTSN